MTKILGISLLIFMSACQYKNSVKKLNLIQAFEVQIQNKYEPSGLTLWDGEFYTVSDDHDTIFHLLFEQDKITLEPFIQISNVTGAKLDFEGITHDDHYFYLVSEMNFNILKVSKNGEQQTWMPAGDQIKKEGQKQGLFQKRGAYFEGLCYLSPDHFLLAAERDPRGLIDVDFSDNKINHINAYLSDVSKYKLKQNRSTDFTGLSCNDGIYVLERNGYLVSSLKKQNGKLHESRGWSYQHIIEQPEFLYQDMKYGHAEGLVVKGDKVFIILDNNKNPHQLNPKNNNSLFLELQM